MPTKTKKRPSYTIADMRAVARERGGKCLSDTYVDNRTPMEWECALGHTWDQKAGHILSGHWCGKCHGNAPLDLAEFKEIAEQRGGKCLSRKYVNIGTNLRWECAEGHRWEATPGNVKRGTWCKECSAGLGERLCRAFFEQLFGKPFPTKRPAWLISNEGGRCELDGYCEELQLAFEHHGEQHYRAATGLYTDETKLQERRALDHRKRRLCKKLAVVLIEIPEVPRLTPLDALRKFIADECRKRGVKLPRGFWKRDIDLTKAYSSQKLLQMQRLAERKGGKCLSTKFIDTKTSLIWQCSEGHIWEATSEHIKRGQWCRICAGFAEITLATLQDAAKKRGGRCLATEYINAHQVVMWECKKKHRWPAEAASILYKESWCPDCAGNKKKTIEEMKLVAEAKGGECLSQKYLGANTNLKWRCSDGHVFERTPNHVINEDRWCRQCAD